MKKSTLEARFEAAAEKAAKTKLVLAPDVLLHLYAYYKQASGESLSYKIIPDNDLRSAFKQNALFQARNLSRKQAMKRYIEYVERYIID
ncbi:MAG: acyl-CoA-binding protein [Flavobacteriaceae bacterium]|nr:acyl-CoA-binding protein [Flavobacteriaceae bacterium]